MPVKGMICGPAGAVLLGGSGNDVFFAGRNTRVIMAAQDEIVSIVGPRHRLKKGRHGCWQ